MPSLYPGDATGNDAVAMRDVLTERGWDARLFAESSDPALGADSASAAQSYLEAAPSVAILHQSTQWPRGLRLLGVGRGARVVRDHNVTPARFFAGLSPAFEEASVEGACHRRQLAGDARVDLFLPASRTNAEELVALGAGPDRIAVVPPFHRIDDLVDLVPDEAALRRWTGGPTTALFVGRVAPNKGHRRILRVAAVFAELFGEALRVRFVGAQDPRLGSWQRVLERDARRFGVEGMVEFLGKRTEAELKAAYLTSHVFLCCSEHEGFCVPLVEAGHLGCPVVAIHQPAIAETLGRSGLVLVEPSDEVIAAAVRRVTVDAGVRERLVAGLRSEVLTRFSTKRIRQEFLDAVEPLAAG